MSDIQQFELRYQELSNSGAQKELSLFNSKARFCYNFNMKRDTLWSTLKDAILLGTLHVYGKVQENYLLLTSSFKGVLKVKRIDKELKEIDKRRQEAEESFVKEMEIREILSKKVQFFTTRIYIPKQQEYLMAQQREKRESLLRDIQRDQMDLEDQETVKVFNDTAQAGNTLSIKQKDSMQDQLSSKMKNLQGGYIVINH